MIATNIVKPLVLKTTGVVTALAVTSALNKGINTIAPEFLAYYNGMSKKERAIWTAKFVGATVAVAIVASVVAGAATNAVEHTFWNDQAYIEN